MTERDKNLYTGDRDFGRNFKTESFSHQNKPASFKYAKSITMS